jgi:hypothetical protein
VASAQNGGNSGQNAPNGNGQNESPGNSGHDQSPGNSGHDQSPGNSGHDQSPGNSGHDQSPGNSGHDQPPGYSGHDQSPRNSGSTGRRTPDGTPPSEEDVCDDLKYGTPGLFGLCIAFCEAHDCIPDYLLENPYANCKKSDSRILDNYNRKMRDGDPKMPCLPGKHDSEPNLCPCWSRTQLAMFPYADTLSNVSGNWLSTRIEDHYEEWDDGELDCSQDEDIIGETVNLTDGTTLHFDIAAFKGDCDGMYCSGVIYCENSNDDIVTCPEGVETSDYTPEEITDEEYEACAQQIRDLEPYTY